MDKLDSSIHDVRIYSKGLVTAIQSKKFAEIEDYTKKMQTILNDILIHASVQKSQLKPSMKFNELESLS